MKKMMQKLQENRKNNKGFTLVELIIVIAIIAVLAAVLAPQYIRYVERARESNDASYAASIQQAAVVAALDPVNKLTTFTVTWDTNGGGGITVGSPTPTGASVTAAQNAIQAVVGGKITGNPATGGIEAQSKVGKATDFTVRIVDGKIETGTNPWASIMG